MQCLVFGLSYEMWDSVFGIWDNVFGIWVGVLATWEGVFGIWDSVFCIWYYGYTQSRTTFQILDVFSIWKGILSIWDCVFGIRDGKLSMLKNSKSSPAHVLSPGDIFVSL